MNVTKKIILSEEAKKTATLRRTTYATSSNFDRELAYVKGVLKNNGVAITNISTYYVISKFFSEPDPQAWNLLKLYKVPKEELFKDIIKTVEESNDMFLENMTR